MLKALGNIFKSKAQAIKPILITVKSVNGIETLSCKSGENLMDATNKSINSNTNVYGLCDKQLACTTCSVEIEKLYEKTVQPKDDELDVLYTIPNYKENCTRMACQIKITPEMEGMVVRIPKKGLAIKH